MSRPKQLTLDISNKRSLYKKEDYFYHPSNEKAYDFLIGETPWLFPFAAIIGERGSGKTHLSQIYKHISGAVDMTPDQIPYFLENPHSRPIILDMSPALKGDDEESLFHLYNHIKMRNTHLLILSRTALDKWPTNLKDLSSRLKTFLQFFILPPDEDLISALLQKQFSDRQIQISSEVIKYLSTRIERNYSAIQDAVERLDKASLLKSQKVTIPLIKEVFPEEL